MKREMWGFRIVVIAMLTLIVACRGDAPAGAFGGIDRVEFDDATCFVAQDYAGNVQSISCLRKP